MKRNTAWAFAGNSVYAGCQWAVFVLLVKTLAVEDAGAFAYAAAITGPIFVFANVRLRTLVATGFEAPGGFTDYLNARLLTTAAAVIASIAVGSFASPDSGFLAVLAVMTFGRACDAVSEICHGLFQRELDMRTAAIGLSINGIASVSFVAAAVVLTSSIVAATAAYAAGSLLALAGWDAPRTLRIGRAGERASDARHRSARASLAAAWGLIATALPLGVSSAIGSVQSNLPRYVIASMLGTAMLAKFVALSFVTMAGHLIVNAASQAALPQLAKDARAAQSSYRARLGALVAGTITLGAVGVLATYLFGRSVLAAIYGREYANEANVLLWLVVAMVMTFASVFFGTGITARYRFASQSAVSALSLAVVGACIVPFVGKYGLVGAAWSLVAGAIVELVMYTALTARDLRPEAGPSDLMDRALVEGVRP
jgi:O-antigen/teichoic acid export membrane protein